MIDTAHLNTPASFEPFVLSGAMLARLAENMAYPLAQDYLLFGIRAGKLLEGNYGQWLTDAVIAEQLLDGEQLGCLLGIWNRQTHKIALFPASTIPHRAWQQKQIEMPEKKIANCLGSGLYHYKVGAHEPEGRPFEEGAFRLTREQPAFAWRFYTPSHRFSVENGVPTLSVVNDHIHSAQSTTQIGGISFSSAGCQVIEGDHTPPAAPTGFYQTFRILAGQSAQPSPLEIATPYQYLLTHARHLELIAAGENSLRLLQGSRGMNVRLLQEALMQRGFLDENMIDKGTFNGYTAEALYRYQKEAGLRADGIATLKDLKMLGVTPIC